MFRTARRGFTLIEVLVVATIIGIAAAVVVPSLRSRGDLDLQAAVRQLVADVSFAQGDALANQGFRRIHFFADGTGWCILRLDERSLRDDFDPAEAEYVDDPLAGGGKGGGSITRLSAGERFSSVRIDRVAIDGDRRDLTFDALGGTVDPDGDPGLGGSIVLRSDDAAFEVTLSPLTGRIEVRRLEAADAADGDQ